MRTLIHLLPRQPFQATVSTGWGWAFGLTWGLVCAVGLVGVSSAQDGSIIPTAAGPAPVIPASYTGGGSFFNSGLGTAFRINYHSEGYGTQEGVVSLGAMKVIDHGGAVTFFDGQGTLSDEFGGGFNAGVGYRWMHDSYFTPDPKRITGFNFWTDGQSTSADNFFTQLGIGWESLGDLWDFRFNGYFPLERTKLGASTVTGTGLFFLGDALVGDTIDTTVDTALTVVDGELARRIADLEAWAFVGGYFLDGGSIDTEEGFRAGVRGYAVPDLALSLQVTDDDVYHTNVMFGVTWFVGRTNKCTLPCGTLEDRFREPVMRNDFIATSQRVVSGVGGSALTSQTTGAALDFVHVDDSAPVGGDGTIENPVNTLAAAEAAGADNSIIFVHSGSSLAGGITLKNGQQVLGEGVDAGGVVPVSHFVDTVQSGTVQLPESSTGASSGAMPTIAGAGDVFTFFDNNSVNNFTINGGTRAIVANGVAAPQLQNLEINNQTGDAVVLTGLTGTPVVDNTVNITGVAAGFTGMVIDGGDTTFAINANITNTTNPTAQSLIIRKRTAGTITYGGDITDTGEGLLFEDNTGGTVAFSAASDVNLDVTGTSTALALSNNEGATFTFNDLAITSVDGNGVSILGGGTISILDTNSTSSIANSGTGDAVNVIGDINGGAMGDATVTIAADITNSTGGRAVDIRRMASNGVTINGTVDVTSGGGVSVLDNTGGNHLFTSQLTLNTGTNDAVLLDKNTGATISFNGVGIDTTSGAGFSATNGGTLAVTGTNTIVTTTGNGLVIDGMTVDTGGAVFDSITVSGAANGIILKDLTGGLVTAGSGTNPGDGGTMTTTGTAIIIDNVVNASVNNITVNNTGALGLDVKNNDSGAVSVNGVDITATTATNGATIIGNDGAAILVDGLMVDTTAGDAVVVTDSSNVTISNSTIDNAGANAINGSHSGTTASSLTLSNLTVNNAGTNAVNITHSGTGAYDVNVNNSTVNSATGSGVVATANGAGLFDLTVDNSSIGSVGQKGVFLTTGVNSDRVNFTLTNNNSIVAGDDNALAASLSGGTGDVRLLIRDNTLRNNSATSETVDISVTSDLTLNANIGAEDTNAVVGDRNTFTNNGAGRAFLMDVNSASATINLDMQDNTGASGGAVGFRFTKTSGIFGIVDKASMLPAAPPAAGATNVGIIDLGGNVIGDFDNLAPPISFP